MDFSKRNSKKHMTSRKQKLGSFFAVLLLIIFPIAQLNIIALTNDAPKLEKLEKAKKSSIGELLNQDASLLENSVQETSPLPKLKTSETTEETKEEKDDKEEKEEKDEDSKDNNKNNIDDNNDDNNSVSNEQRSTSNSSNSKNSSSKSNDTKSNDKKDDSSSKDSGSDKKDDKSDSDDDEKPKSGHWEKRISKEAYDEVVTVTKYRCMCGAIFDSPEAWQAHRPNP